MVTPENQAILAAARAAKTTRLTGEEFLAEYAKESQFHIDLDPRIDLAEPIYEQAMRLLAMDKAAEKNQAVQEDKNRAA